MTSYDQESIRERVWQAAVRVGRILADPEVTQLAEAAIELDELCVEAAKSEQRPNAGQATEEHVQREPWNND